MGKKYSTSPLSHLAVIINLIIEEIMAPDILDQAIQYLRAGNKQAALPLLKQMVQSEPRNESAWLHLYACLDDIGQKKFCLQKVLEINPDNVNARTALGQLNALELPITSNGTTVHTVPVSQKNPPVPTASAVRPTQLSSPAARVDSSKTAKPAGNPGSSGEVIYYQKNPVTVTSHRVIFAGNTHVLRNINSVGMVKLPPRRSTGRIIAGISFLIMICLGVATIGQTKTNTAIFLMEAASFTGVIVGLVLSFSAKPHYAVQLISGSGELNGYVSKDQQEVAAIVDAINRAIVDRS
jgi:hypothetical protein